MEQDAKWTWRNCRSIGLGARLWLWPMSFGWHVDEDCYGGGRYLYLGPLEISIHYSIGNVSAYHWWERLGALSEAEAFDRALRSQGRPSP